MAATICPLGCGRATHKGSELCYWHDMERIEKQRKIGNRKGAKRLGDYA